MQLGTRLHRFAEQTERLSALDNVAGPLARNADRLVRQARLKHALSGSWLGHPLHPLATDVVIGSWTMAAILDLRHADDSDGAAKTLVGVGVLAAIPTAASGVSDWADTLDPGVRRMGLVHAAGNVVALALNAASYLARRGGRRAVGGRLTAASALPLAIGGFLGAHMAYARGVGVSHTVFDERIAEWTPLATEAALGEGWTEATFTACGSWHRSAKGTQAGWLPPPAPIAVPACGRSRVAVQSGVRRTAAFFAATTARYSRGPPRRPFRTSRRGLAETASKSGRPAQPADCSPRLRAPGPS
jgi:uncharacterized membrane protein